jgi:hypothetical protein
MQVRIPNTVQQSMLMFVLVFSFASTLLPLQMLALVVGCVFLTFYRKAIFVGSSGAAGVLWILLLPMLLSLPFNIWRSPSVLPYVFVEGVSIALALVLVLNREAYWQASRVVLLSSQLLVLGYLAIVGFEDFPLDDMIPGASSNGVTSYLVLLQCNYGVARFVATQRVSLFTAAVTLGICIIGWGRGSMVASLGLFVLNTVYLPRQWKIFGRWWPALSVLTLALLIAPSWDAVISYLEANTKLGSGFYDASRASILEAYLGKLDGWTLVWGADYRGTGVDEYYLGNPHNSFIRAHHLFGFFYLVIIFLAILWVFSRNILFAMKLFGSASLLILLFRSFTEPILFPTLLDVFFFGMCLLLGRANRTSEVPLAR